MALRSSIKEMQAEKFKEGYLKEMDIVMKFLKDKVKAKEDLTTEDIEEAKNILVTNIDKIASLNTNAGDLETEVEDEEETSTSYTGNTMYNY